MRFFLVASLVSYTRIKAERLFLHAFVFKLKFNLLFSGVAPNLTIPPPISNSSIQSCIVPNMSIPPPKLPNNSTITSMEFGINNVSSNVSAPISNIAMNIQNLNIPITSAHLMRQNEPSEIQNSGNSNWKRIQTGNEHKEDSWNIREKEIIKNDIMNTDNEQMEFREETQIEKIQDEKHNSEMNSNALLNNNKELTGQLRNKIYFTQPLWSCTIWFYIEYRGLSAPHSKGKFEEERAIPSARNVKIIKFFKNVKIFGIPAMSCEFS
jgi:hypothetical protein